MTALPNPGRRADLLAILALLAACFAVYGQTLGFGFINLDDQGYVANNANVQGGLSWAGFRWAWTTLDQSNWHPLTWLSLMADAQWCGANPGGYHLTNLLIHCANTSLLFVWLRRAAGAFWPSAMVALFFAVHPLHVESVAWISERKDVLSVLFCLLTLLAYTRYARTGARGTYALSLVLYSLGLAAKPMLVTVPVLLLLIDWWPLQRGTWRLMEKAPFFALALASCVITMIAQRAGNAVVPYAALSTETRVADAMAGLGGYLGLTFWPLRLGVYYPYWSQCPLWQPIVSALLIAALTIFAWRLRRDLPYTFMGWAWFLIALLPVIGIVQVGGQAMADRYAYLPHVGLFIAITFGGAELARGLPAIRLPLAMLTTIAAIACGALAVRQASYWRDGFTLFTHTHEIARPSANLCALYGEAAVAAGRFPEAEAAYREGVSLRPNKGALLGELGYVLLCENRLSPALAALGDADRLAPGNERTLYNLARTLARLGQNKEAADVYARCLEAHPHSVAARIGLADTLISLEEPARAVAEYEKALAREPGNVTALDHLVWLLAFGAGERQPPAPARALELAQRAVSLTSGGDMDSLDALAAALAANGYWDAAVAASEISLRLAERVGAPQPLVEIHRKRHEAYRAKQLPAH